MSSSADLYCVMGNPVAHSRSPAIHARFAELTGEHLVYERCLLPIDGFAQGVRDFIARGGRGCNVTVPFKIEAAALATHRSERVQLAGAANTLVFAPDGIHADNTDGLGLVADITRNAGLALAGRDVLLEIDWQGARQVRLKVPDAVGVFILPPSREALEQRMRNRGQDSEAVIAQRLAAAREEMSHYGEFDYVIVNEVFETAVDEMCAIFTASRLRREPQVARHQGLISALLVEDRAVPSG